MLKYNLYVLYTKDKKVSACIKSSKSLKSVIRNRQFDLCGEHNRKLCLRSQKGN